MTGIMDGTYSGCAAVTLLLNWWHVAVAYSIWITVTVSFVTNCYKWNSYSNPDATNKAKETWTANVTARRCWFALSVGPVFDRPAKRPRRLANMQPSHAVSTRNRSMRIFHFSSFFLSHAHVNETKLEISSNCIWHLYWILKLAYSVTHFKNHRIHFWTVTSVTSTSAVALLWLPQECA